MAGRPGHDDKLCSMRSGCCRSHHAESMHVHHVPGPLASAQAMLDQHAQGDLPPSVACTCMELSCLHNCMQFCKVHFIVQHVTLCFRPQIVSPPALHAAPPHLRTPCSPCRSRGRRASAGSSACRMLTVRPAGRASACPAAAGSRKPITRLTLASQLAADHAQLLLQQSHHKNERVPMLASAWLM